MKFASEWAECYALEYLKDHLEFLPLFVIAFKDEISKLQKGNVSVWANLSVDLRSQLLSIVAQFAPTLLALPIESVCDVVMECLEENKIKLRRKWVMLNINDFIADLESALSVYNQ